MLSWNCGLEPSVCPASLIRIPRMAELFKCLFKVLEFLLVFELANDWIVGNLLML